MYSLKYILQWDSNTEQLRCHNLSRQKTRCNNNNIILPTQKDIQICSIVKVYTELGSMYIWRLKEVICWIICRSWIAMVPRLLYVVAILRLSVYLVYCLKHIFEFWSVISTYDFFCAARFIIFCFINPILYLREILFFNCIVICKIEF